MSGTITATEMEHLLAVRDRAESSYAQLCRMLVAQPHDVHALAQVQQAAVELGAAQAQYAMALALLWASEDPRSVMERRDRPSAL